MNYINFINFKDTDIGKDFINNNRGKGLLKIEAFMAYKAIPIENVKVLITKDIEDYRVIFYQGITDSSGMIDNIELLCPISSDIDEPMYTIYNVTCVNEELNMIKTYEVGIFNNEKSIQYVKFTGELDV